MRLISCHISGFGKFSNQKINLADNIVMIKADNGWGKTTLAHFIESMFYGLDGAKKRSIAENYRTKYMPWQGGAFGGSLVFSVGEKQYRIERTFGKTPSADTVRLYYANNAPCHEFGNNLDEIGKVLFGVDRESYARSVYLPQGEIETDGFPADIRGKLVALLTTGGMSADGKKDAVTLLDEAERAIKAKRRPAKGKLDEVEDALLQIEEKKIVCSNAANAAADRRREMAAANQKLQALIEQTAAMQKKIEKLQAAKHAALQTHAVETLKTSMQEAEMRMQFLTRFFGEIEPTGVNTDGISEAVDSYYELLSQKQSLQEEMQGRNEQLQRLQKLQAQIEANKKTLENFELMREKEEGDKKKDDKKKKKKKPMSETSALILLVISMFAGLWGVSQITSNPILGVPLAILGVGGLVISIIALLRAVLTPKNKIDKPFKDKKLNAAYREAKEEEYALMQQLAQIPDGVSTRSEEDRQKLETLNAKIRGLKEAVDKFFSNFHYEETYDYRANLSLLISRVNEYIKYKKALEENRQKLGEYKAQDSEAQEDNDIPKDSVEVQLLLSALERNYAEAINEKNTLVELRGKLLAQTEALEKQAAAKADLQSEESLLLEEKARLERRLLAIRRAKEILVRARENMATKYLEPVENACKRYAKAMGLAFSEFMRFQPSGAPMVEENGVLCPVDYYSEGTRALFDLCIRLALVECLFEKTAPVLLLDDPFTHLDDSKTEKAKLLVYELSRKYQIVYFTCKEERKL